VRRSLRSRVPNSGSLASRVAEVVAPTPGMLRRRLSFVRQAMKGPKMLRFQTEDRDA
jgi:hypothetical protein